MLYIIIYKLVEAHGWRAIYPHGRTIIRCCQMPLKPKISISDVSQFLLTVYLQLQYTIYISRFGDIFVCTLVLAMRKHIFLNKSFVIHKSISST